MTLPAHHAASYIEGPLEVADVSDIVWEDQTDVLVVGYGAAGLCAALAAREVGANVLAVDRFKGGGATGLSGGIIYAGGTPYQESAGIKDSASAMYDYLKAEIGDVVKDETLRRFCDSSRESLEWLTRNGVEFGTNVYPGKRSYPPKGFDLYFSGNENAVFMKKVAVPAQRGHRVKGVGYTGKDLSRILSQTAAEKGVRTRYHTLVKRLVVDSSGRVVGVEAIRLAPGSEGYRRHEKLIKKVNAFQRFIENSALKAAAKIREVEEKYGEKIFIRADKAVILTTGSFAFNREMVRHYAPAYGNAMPLGTVSCDGSGILLGKGVGAAIGRMDSVTAWRSISPPEIFVKSVVVNQEGRRFINEDAYLGHLGNAIAEQSGQKAWVVIDSESYWKSYKDTIPRFGEEGYLEFRGPLLLNLLFNSTRGATLQALADKLGMDGAVLAEEVTSYNASVVAENDVFHKKPENSRALGNGPYYAIDISMGSKKYPCPTIPMGGLCVDEDTGHVLTEQGAPISGLYAAGRAAVGIPSGFYVSGTSIADCVFSGRRAGHQAATEK